MKARGRAQAIFARSRERMSDLLYGLIQPRQIPAHPRRPPRIRVEVLITIYQLAIARH